MSQVENVITKKYLQKWQITLIVEQMGFHKQTPVDNVICVWFVYKLIIIFVLIIPVDHVFVRDRFTLCFFF